MTGGVTNLCLDLVHGVGGVNKLGHVEADVLDLVLALDLCDLNGLGHTDFLGSWVRKRAGDLQGGGDQRDLVSLGLVLLTADLVFPLAVSVVTIAIAGSSTGSHLHGLRLVLVGDLGGGAGGGDGLLLVHVGADLSLHDGRGLLAHCQHTVEAVVVVDHLLDGQGDGGHLVSEGGDADLSVDGVVGVPAVKLRSVSISMGRGVDVSQSGGESDGEDKKSLKCKKYQLTETHNNIVFTRADSSTKTRKVDQYIADHGLRIKTSEGTTDGSTATITLLHSCGQLYQVLSFRCRIIMIMKV